MRFQKISAVALILAPAALSSFAQQLNNASFEQWEDCIPWNSKNTTTVQGTTPTGWCVSNVVTPSMSLGNVSIASTATGNNSDNAVLLTNKSAAGQVIPGYITLGTTWATARVKGTSPMSGTTDGGTWGSINFNYKPDAFAFDYIRTQGSGSTQPATAIAYLWKGTTSQDEVPAVNTYKLLGTPDTPTTVTMIDRERNVLGKEYLLGGTVTKSDDFELIATVTHYIKEANSEWNTIVVPIEYLTTSEPTKLNIIFSAADYFADRSDNKASDALTLDNVKLIYYSRLSALKVNGVDIDGFNSETYTYSVNTVYSTDNTVTATVLGQSATHTVTYDADNYTATVTVTNVDADTDGQSTHTYTIQFAEPAGQPVNVNTALFEGTNSTSVNGGETTTTEKQHILVTNTGVGTCDLTFKNLSFGVTGDVIVAGVNTTQISGKTDIKYVGSATGLAIGEDGDIIDIDVEGKEDADHNMTMYLHIKWYAQAQQSRASDAYTAVEIVFNGFNYDIATGIDEINTDNSEATPRYFLINGVEVNDATAPGLYIVRRGNTVTKLLKK